MTDPDAPVGLSKHRLEALTDGIFAVAMTLLVIELKVPERAGMELSRLAQAIADLIPTFSAWIISFFSSASSGSATIGCFTTCVSSMPSWSGSMSCT